MASSDFLSIDEAAQCLGRSSQAVRMMAASGELDAVKRGHSWWLDARAVERRRRDPPGRGRPLSPEMAWSVLFLASREPEHAQCVANAAHQPSRARRWLREHPLPAHVRGLRARGRRESFHAHPAELHRIIDRRDLMSTGISAAEEVGLHGRGAAAEFYAPASARRAIVGEHALEQGSGSVLARWVPDDVWPAIARARAPRAAVLVDLLENDDPRARREAGRALAADDRD
jgi:excisionase family DNA binding protein